MNARGGGTLRYNDAPKNIRVLADLLWLQFGNRFSRRSIVDRRNNWVVSSTTHGHRLRKVYVSIESVGRGTVLPGRQILWLDDAELFAKKPRSLRRLERRGLEVRLVDHGLRVHTKYWPYVDSYELHESSLIVCDDDIIYPRSWLQGLIEASERFPGHIIAYRTHTIRVNDGVISPYVTWTPTDNSEPAFRRFPTAVSGTVYPAELLNISKARGLEFLTESPMNDDVWLHALAVHAGIQTVQVTSHPQHFPFVPGTQESGLYMTNIGSGGNDRQIARSYSALAVSRLERECHDGK